MISFFVSLKDQLDALDPRAFYIVIALLSAVVIYVWRKVSMATFEKIPAPFQALPAVLLAAALAFTSSADIKAAFVNALWGALSGVLAVGGHTVLKQLPGPYQGASGKVIMMALFLASVSATTSACQIAKPACQVIHLADYLCTTLVMADGSEIALTKADTDTPDHLATAMGRRGVKGCR